MVRFLTLGFLFSVLLGATGCTTAAVAVIDEKISQMTEMECTSVNVMLGENYCKDRTQTIKQEPIYCYKTLGGIDCYREENPYSTEKSERVREVSALGSEGAAVEYVSSKKDSLWKFRLPFFDSKDETAELD